MNYKSEAYIGKKIQLYPGDTLTKYGIIKNVDDLGWTIEITDVIGTDSSYHKGDTVFLSHSKPFYFTFVK